MKKLKFIVLFLFTLIFINGTGFHLHAWGYPGEVDVILIKFNYDQNSISYDAINIKKNHYQQTIYCDEWEVKNGSIDRKYFAYIKNQSNRNIRVRFWHNQDHHKYFEMLIHTELYSGTGFGTFAQDMVVFPANDDGDSELTTFEFYGSVPGSVGDRAATYKWLIDFSPHGAPSSNNIGFTTHDYYTLFASPKAPMTVPWDDVLEYSCSLASGQTYSSDVAKKITEGIYYMGDTDGDIDYNGASINYSGGVDHRSFNLTGFLQAIKNSSTVIVNCSDVANLFNTFSSSLGLSSYSKRIEALTGSTFTTKSLDPIGSPGWKIATWGYHQFGWFDSKVNDACIRVNPSSPIIPSNMTQNTYDLYLLANGQSYSESNIGVCSVE